MSVQEVLAYVIGFAVVLVGVAISIALHELGHLIPAKLFRVKVTKYMIGFGPTLFSRKRGETEYGIKALPLGGYISMAGMFPPATTAEGKSAERGFFRGLIQEARDASADPNVEETRVFYKLAVWKRIIIMLGGPVMNLLLATVFFIVLLCGMGISVPSTTVGSVSQCVIPASDSTRTTCTATDPKAPAAAAGVHPGDVLVSIAGVPVQSWTQATDIIRAHPNRTVPLVVERNGARLTLSVTPLSNQVAVTDAKGNPKLDASGKPATTQAGYIGIGSQLMPYQHQSLGYALSSVGDNLGQVANILVTLPARLVDVAKSAFGNAPRDLNSPVSIVGVGRLAGEVISRPQITVLDKTAVMLGLLASLNIALFVFNLIPLLPLDGGHVLGALWEFVKRGWARVFHRPPPKPVDLAKLMPLTYVVTIVLLAMGGLLIYADVVKPLQLF